MKDPRDVIVAPVVSEKSYALMEEGVYTFKVHPSASKPEIRDAVQSIFGVRVAKVNTLNRPGKRKRNRARSPTARVPTPSGRSSPSSRARRSTCSRIEARLVMALRKRKPTSPGRRFQTVADFSEVTRDRPERSLVDKKSSTGGRNVHGRKTARHRGGGHKQRYRVIDFRRTKDGVPATVAAIEYDPNRSCRIALLHYLDGEKRYILAPRGVAVGDTLQSGQGSEIRPGNALPLRYIPVGTTVHNIELQPGGGGKLARSAGSSVVLLAKEGSYATLRLPSTEMRRVSIDCRATVGEVGNSEHELDQDRQGRPQPVEGRPPPDPRRGHEPGRPPARWRRGQVLGWPPPGVALGPARGPHPQEEPSRPTSSSCVAAVPAASRR